MPVALPHMLTAAMGLGKASACCVRSGNRHHHLCESRTDLPSVPSLWATPSVAPQAQRPSETQLRVVLHQQEAAE